MEARPFDRGIRTKQAVLSTFRSIDPFAINFEEKHYDTFTDSELVAHAGNLLLFDSECFPNYYLVAFKSLESKKVVEFEISPSSTINLRKLEWVLKNFCIVGFNSRSYDVPLLVMVQRGYSADQLKAVSNQIIFQELRSFAFEKEFGVKIPTYNHIDLIEVAPLQASLKLYAGRLHAQRMQELPLAHDKMLTEVEAKAVKLYCINDLDNTGLLYYELKPAIDLRIQLSREINQDLRSHSDAQIAEQVISCEIAKLQGFRPKKPTIETGSSFYYQVPNYIEYKTPQLQAMLDKVRKAPFVIQGNGTVAMPPELDGLTINLGNCTYRMGIGGLHSSEECIAHKSDDEFVLIDKDVASYYPAIILTLGLTPKHLGKNFLKVYRGIVQRRLQAKQTAPKGVVEQSLKITINGSFGKLGNPYSVLYSPDLLIQVTVTGQLALLLLIEFIELSDIRVVSANTDGVVVRCPRSRYQYLEAAVVHWERVTGFETEEARYKAVYSRDVNNYIAVKEDNKVKVKGTYAERGSSGNSVLSKNPENFVCHDAIVALLTKGTPIKETVEACKDIRRFVTVRTVKGGGEKSGAYLGRVVRWYRSTVMKGTITYRLTGNKVPNSDNAMPLMELPAEFPSDVDLDYYIAEAESMLHDIGYYPKVKVASLPLF